MDKLALKNAAIHWAWETHGNRFNVAEKPSADEVIEIAKKFEEYIKEADSDSF